MAFIIEAAQLHGLAIVDAANISLLILAKIGVNILQHIESVEKRVL